MSQQFIVDLGDVDLADEHKEQLNAAIQKAVSGTLADIGKSGKLGLFPFDQIPGGQFPGLIIRDFSTLNDIQFNKLFDQDFNNIIGPHE